MCNQTQLKAYSDPDRQSIGNWSFDPCIHQLDELLTVPLAEHLLFQVICRWSCARCWRAIMALARQKEWLKQRNIAVIVVGPRDQLESARGLAAKLQLPFSLICDDHGRLRQKYQLVRCRVADHTPTPVLVDKQGQIHHCLPWWFSKEKHY